MKRAIKTATIFDGRVDVYQLEDGAILISNRGAVRAITDGASTNKALAEYTSRIPAKYVGLSSPPTRRFVRPEGGTAEGLTPDTLLAIMRAYSEAFDEGELAASQAPLARNCNRILRALTEVGLVKVCEEALGLVRGNAGELFRTALFREEAAKDAIWPIRFVEQYAHWNGYKWRDGQSPPYSMQSANGFFYDMIFDSVTRRLVQDMGIEMACKQHQVLAEYPRDYVKSQLAVATSLALFSISESQWRKKMRVYFKKIEPGRRPLHDDDTLPMFGGVERGRVAALT